MPWTHDCAGSAPANFDNADATRLIQQADFNNAFYVETKTEGKNKNQLLKKAVTYVNHNDGTDDWVLLVGANIHIKKKSKELIDGHAYLYGWYNFDLRCTQAQGDEVFFQSNKGSMPGNTCPVKTSSNTNLDGSHVDMDLNQINLGSPPPEAGPVILQTPDSNTSKYNKPVTKHYTFNETGNIMIASTIDNSESISQAAQDLFQEVAVFFAALTKSLASTPRADAVKPYDSTDYYTLYDYAPIEAIVQKSGMFVTVNREDLSYTKSGTSATFNTEMIASILGFAATDGADVAALAEVLRQMGKHATIGYTKTKSYSKIGHLTFVCEYLMGMPLVNVEYYYIDEDMVKKVVHIGPCISAGHVSATLKVHKDTFMFVPPDWIRKYSGDLASVADTKEFQLLVQELESYITGTPVILGIKTATAGGTEITDGKLTKATNYVISGLNLGSPSTGSTPKAPGKVYIGGVEQGLANASAWSNESITFKATPNPSSDAVGNVILVYRDAKIKSPESSDIFTVGS